MKKITNTLNNIQKNKIASSLQHSLDNLIATPLSYQSDVIQRVSKIQSETPELILNQSLLKAMLPRFSVKKSNYIEAFREMNSEYMKKISLENGKVPCDIRHISELLIADRYSRTSDLIKEVILRDETDGKTVSKDVLLSTSNKNPDLYVTFTDNICIERDIKSGNITENTLRCGFLQEIPYITEMMPYSQAMNTIISLGSIAKMKKNYIRKLYLENRDIALRDHLITMDHLEIFRDKSEIFYNQLLQDEMYKNMSLYVKYNLNFSCYYGRIVHEFNVNPDFFSNKQKAGLFIARAIITYHETIQPVMKNVQQTQGTNFDLDKWLQILKALPGDELF